MTNGCFYCLEGVISEALNCTSLCLSSSNIPPEYPGGLIFGSVTLSIVFLFLATHFKDDLKRLIGFRLVSIAFVSIAFFTVGLVFHNHSILKNLPMVIPGIGVSSYMISYFLSFYLIKFSYGSTELENISMNKYVHKIAERLRISLPKLYVFLSKEPKAFAVDGFRKAIFLSDSLIERLDEESLKAVLLHEIYHLKRRTGMLKNVLNSIGNFNFGLLPAPVNELERFEEGEIDRILLDKHGIDIEGIKRKLW